MNRKLSEFHTCSTHDFVTQDSHIRWATGIYTHYSHILVSFILYTQGKIVDELPLYDFDETGII